MVPGAVGSELQTPRHLPPGFEVSAIRFGMTPRTTASIRSDYWSSFSSRIPNVYIEAQGRDARNLIEALLTSGANVATPDGVLGTPIPKAQPYAVSVGDTYYGTQTEALTVGAALASRSDWLVAGESGVAVNEAWAILRPWALQRPAYCVLDAPSDEPFMAPSPSWALNSAVLHLLPEILLFRGSGAPEDLAQLVSHCGLRLERLLQIRSRIENARFSDEAFWGERDLMVDALLVFATAALDTLAELAFETAQQSHRMARSLRTIRPKAGKKIPPMHSVISCMSAGKRVDASDRVFDDVEDALCFLYQARNVLAHERPGETRVYQVAKRRLGHSHQPYYDDPNRPKSRRLISHGRGVHSHSLLRLDLGGRFGEPDIEAWNSTCGDLGVYTDRDVAFIEPIVFSSQVVSFVRRWMRLTMESVVGVLQSRGSVDPAKAPTLERVRQHQGIHSLAAWRLGAAFACEEDLKFPVPFS